VTRQQALRGARYRGMTGWWWRPPADKTIPVGVAGLCPRSVIFVCLVEFGLNPAFAVLFLRSQNIPYQVGLVCLLRYVTILAWVLAGAARHLF
jgi:hypothetical protein